MRHRELHNEIAKMLVGPAFVNVKGSGAKGDGVTDDTQEHIDAFVDGKSVYTPAGTYIVGTSTDQGIQPAAQNGIHWSGAGWGTVLKRADIAGNRRTFVFEGCDNLIIENLAFDVNHITAFGGLIIGGCDNVIIRNLHLFDSNLDAGWTSFDHFGLLIQDCTNIIVENCFAEDVELLEIENCDRVIVRNNISLRAAGTTGIGSFTVGNGYYLRDAVFENNYIIDPRKAGFVLGHESGGLSNNIWRRVRIEGNHIVHSTIVGTSAGMVVGNLTGIGTGSGNTYDDIVVEGNHFFVDPALTRTVEELYVQQSNSSERLKVRIRNNTYRGAQSGNYVFRFDRINEGEITGNVVVNTHASGNGMATERMSNMLIADNRVECGSGTAFLFDASEGNNTWARNEYRGSPGTAFGLTPGTNDWFPVMATASLPAAGAVMNNRVLIEDNGTGDRNLIMYAGGQRFRIDGGAAF
jgi:hypothetical protein